MNTDFITPTARLTLKRFPENHDASLQAWDAADEYLLEYLGNNEIDYRSVLILNDGFGALCCALAAHHPSLISDSFLSHQGCRLNLQRNGQDSDAVSALSSLDDWPQQPSLVLLKIPKNHDYLAYQLARLSALVSPATQVIAAARVKELHSSTLRLFERYLGPCHTSLARKKARLIFCEPRGQAMPVPPPRHWQVADIPLHLSNHANVFSGKSLDIGARLFLQHLPSGRSGPVIDLGCGNGVIGIMAARLNPQAEIWFADESYMAIASSKQNVHDNGIDNPCRFITGHSLDGVASASAEIILCNPPFHQQQAVTDHIATQMLQDAKRVLRPGGELRIVGNRHLGYHWRLKQLFGNCKQLAAHPKFVVLAAIKR